LLREGLNVVIAGAANAGKSSLLNALLRDSRAIVTDIPGTTRDSIEERADIRGLPVRLTDTAGVRETAGEIERLGIDRTKEAVADADLVLFLIDGGKATDEDDIAALRSVAKAMKPRDGQRSGRRGDPCPPLTAPDPSSLSGMILIVSKSDLPRVVTDGDIAALFHQSAAASAERGLYIIRVSARTGEGLSALEDAIERAVYDGKAPQADESLVTNARHKDLLLRAAAEISDATDLLERAGDIDLAETNVRAAYDNLGEITGETATDDILNRIFSRFCVGK
jgi:tRNA modification GTPase